MKSVKRKGRKGRIGRKKSVKRGGAKETKEYPDGTYVGNIVNDKREGKGRMQYENGDVYSGNWVNDKREGYGFMRYVNDDSYTGDWVNDMRQGHGQMEYTDGRRDWLVIGDWFNDLPVTKIDVNQIHKFTANIDFPKLNTFLKDHSKNENPYIEQPKLDDFGVYIKDSMDKIIRSTDASKIEERLNNFKRLMEDTLDKIKYYVFSDNLKTGVFLSLKYAQLQPDAFKEAYVESYLEDTCKAHGETNTTGNFSCPTGAFERFVTSLAPAATAVLSTGVTNEEQKQEYEQLVVMITRNPKTLIQKLIDEWQYSHRKGVGLENIVGKEARRADLKAHIEKTVTNDTPEVNALIEELIKEFADPIGYDDEEFPQGGGRTRKRKRKGTKKTKKRKPRKRKGAK